MDLREVPFAQPAPIGPRCPFKEPTMLSTSKTIGWQAAGLFKSAHFARFVAEWAQVARIE
jgi:hypothetical protein